MKTRDKKSAVCNLVLTRLISRKMGDRAVCVASDMWVGATTLRHNWSVCVINKNPMLQPLYVSGTSALEVARKMLSVIESAAQIEKATTQNVAA